MYSFAFQYYNTRFSNASIAKANLSVGVNVINDGSPSLIRIVRRISLGITTRPKSSILLTIPVAFIYKNLTFLKNRRFLKGAKNLVARCPRNKNLLLSNVLLVFVIKGDLFFCFNDFSFSGVLYNVFLMGFISKIHTAKTVLTSL